MGSANGQSFLNPEGIEKSRALYEEFKVFIDAEDEDEEMTYEEENEVGN